MTFQVFQVPMVYASRLQVCVLFLRQFFFHYLLLGFFLVGLHASRFKVGYVIIINFNLELPIKKVVFSGRTGTGLLPKAACAVHLCTLSFEVECTATKCFQIFYWCNHFFPQDTNSSVDYTPRYLFIVLSEKRLRGILQMI